MKLLRYHSTFVHRSRPLLLVVACAAVLTLSACAHLSAGKNSGATGPATVSGQVRSDRGAVIADAAVHLSGPSVRRTARTDIAGRYSFDSVPLGTYNVSAAAAGYKSARQSVTVDKEAVVHADFKLRM